MENLQLNIEQKNLLESVYMRCFDNVKSSDDLIFLVKCAKEENLFFKEYYNALMFEFVLSKPSGNWFYNYCLLNMLDNYEVFEMSVNKASMILNQHVEEYVNKCVDKDCCENVIGLGEKYGFFITSENNERLKYNPRYSSELYNYTKGINENIKKNSFRI